MYLHTYTHTHILLKLQIYELSYILVKYCITEEEKEILAVYIKYKNWEREKEIGHVGGRGGASSDPVVFLLLILNYVETLIPVSSRS